MEDADDKIRRNLLLVSAIVLLVWLLDFQVASTVKLFGVVESPNFSPRKFWTVAGLLILYFALRYRFDDHVRRKFAGIKDELESEYLTVVARPLEKAFLAEIDSSVVGPSSVELGDALLNEYGEPQGKFALVRLTLASFWRGTGKATFSGTVLSSYGVIEFSPEMTFRVSGVLRLSAIVLSISRLTAYSRFGIETLLPVAMATFAFGVCVVKVILN